MKKTVFAILLSMFMPLAMTAQSYSSLWKSVDAAGVKDMLQDRLKALDKIAVKAEAEKQYGHLYKSLLLKSSAVVLLSPDSMDVEVQKLTAREQTIGDKVAKAVFCSALGRIYGLRGESAGTNDEKASCEAKSKDYYARSMADAAMLANVKTSAYEPMVVEGAYSKIFNDDMLHVVGYEAKAFKTMHDYYSAVGNRNATCIAALEMIRATRSEDGAEVNKSHYLQQVDSLLNLYGDLRVAGELALEHYKCLENIENATAAEKVQYINYAVSKWGTWPALNYLRNAKMSLECPSYDINVGDQMLLPDVPRTIRLNSIRNVSQLDFAVYHLSLSGDTGLDPNNDKDYQAIRKHIVGTVAHSAQLRYVGKAPYDEHSDSMTIAPLPVGVYLLEVTSDNKSIKPERCLLHVTNLYTISEKMPGKKVRIAVVNATTGAPVAGAKVRLGFNRSWSDRKQPDETIVMGANGEKIVDCSAKTPTEAYTYTADDKACAPVAVGSYYYGQDGNDAERCVVNTDRAIYRPGQKVMVSVVYWKPDSKQLTAQPLKDKEVTVVLRDANYEEVARQTVVTDDFGQASATFDLPPSGLTGRYRILANGTACTFNVEKYKRPTFTVDIDKVTAAYVAGDTLRVSATARTYAGMPVQNGKVRYSVRRNACMWWRWHDNDDRQALLLTDSATTDGQGRFTMRVPMLLPDKKRKARMYYNVETTATVTDGTGETRQAQLSLPLGNVATVFACDIPDKNLADSLPAMTFDYRNIAGEKLSATVAYTIDGKQYTAPTNSAIDLKPMKLASGLHQLKAVCGTDTIEQRFIVFSLKDKKAPVATHDWFYQSSATFPATIQVGNTDPEHYIFYNVFTNGKVMQSGIMEGHNELHKHTFSYKEEYGDGITVTYAWVNRGHLYTHTAKILRPQPDRKLRMEWTSFRDKLVPGQKERWTLKITAPDGKPADARLMATLYDQSLDALKRHSLSLIGKGQFFNLYTPQASWRGGSYDAVGLYGYMPLSTLPAKEMVLSHFDERCFDAFRSYRYFAIRAYGNKVGVAAPMMKQRMELSAAKDAAENVMLAAAKTQKEYASAATPAAKPAALPTSEPVAEAPMRLRENFCETAFFAPALATNANGEVALSFTLPESATTWRFLAMAHDRHMNYADIEAEAVASKKVMVQPNMPRFIRQGDKAVIAARIGNATNEALKGNARIEIACAESGKVVYTSQKPFTLKAEATEAVEFDVEAKEEGMYICRMVAAGNGFSDGEQHYLPVLSDKEMVTTTMPFTQTKAGTLAIAIDSLLPSKADRRKLTVEYTNNPSWLLIQALPTVSDYCNQSALSLAAAYYATTVSANILGSNPGIKQAIESWNTDGTSMLSALQRNDELKSVVLSESPWMMEAHDEAGQKMLLATYYNKNNLGNKLATLKTLLAETQHYNGSFSWWKGMAGSAYVTTSVATLMARLKMYGYCDAATGNMLARAMKYLDGQAAERIVEMKKTKHPVLSPLDLDYLYLCGINGTEPSASVKYLKSLLLKSNRNTDIRTKAIAAIALGKGNAVAKEYVESIKQYTVSKPGMGRYFDTPKASYSWRNYRIPTHVAAIEAIAAITPADSQTISEMRLWLLQQKRTQAWDTPLNSVDAIHAFLMDNGEVMQQRENTVVSIGGKVLEQSATAAVGYVKTVIDNPKAHSLSFAKPSAGTSWGAVYGQSLQPLSAITSANAGIKVERRLDNAGGSLKVGDKVKVVITVTADRDYDFVQLTDKRAACLEPAGQLSGYRHGCYVAPQDNCTNYFFDRLPKGKHILETEYFVDRPGTYLSGSCTAQCAYSPEFSGRAEAVVITVNK